MLSLEAVGKRYRRGRWIFRDVDLAVGPGEIVAITGGNGSGKSTLLRVLVGLSAPTSGAVRGRPAVVGYVPERFPPGERLSALAYLTHLGRIRGLSTSGATRRADELIERLALVGGKDAPLRTLSAGNAQKVAVAQALLVPPRLLVLDEPWSGLDASAHAVLDELVGEVARDGGAVVFTDHQESTVRATAGYVMRGGRLTRHASGAGVEVVLRPPPDRRDSLAALSTMDGVLDAVASDGLVTVRVARSASDAWLLAVLEQGWSVRSVRSEAAAP